jgi:prepilin signal peptidase PulO-like enzyme (type II secretory pathway)
VLLVLHQLLAARLPKGGVLPIVLEAADRPCVVVWHIRTPLLELLHKILYPWSKHLTVKVHTCRSIAMVSSIVLLGCTSRTLLLKRSHSRL